MIYIWAILTIPQDRLLCTLWTRAVTQPAIVQACGEIDLTPYTARVTLDGVNVCNLPAASLPWAAHDCNLPRRLDDYRLAVVEPNYQETLCVVETTSPDTPSADLLRASCKKLPSAYVTRLWSTRQPTPAPVSCKPPAITQPASIATSETYHHLAAKLIWFGLAPSACKQGEAGVDPLTWSVAPCALDGARIEMIRWQNSLDAAILSAAQTWNVPAATLKNLIASETQFWPWTGVTGEHGLAQITDDGAAVVMHFYYPGYYQLETKAQAEARAEWLRPLNCNYCTPQQAMQRARETMPKTAQALAAYYCMYGSWDAALKAWNIKHSTLDP